LTWSQCCTIGVIVTVPWGLCRILLSRPSFAALG
jgi:hypothetical protein